MDLLTYWGVVKRQRRIVVVGLVITAVLATVLVLKVSTSGVELRRPPSYIATANLFVTQTGFPWGRSALTDYVQGRGTGDEDVAVPRFAEPSRMEYLAGLYSALLLSDDVRALVRRNGFRLVDDEEYDAAALTTQDGRLLPILEVTGISDSPGRAVTIANRAASALRNYVAAEQERSKIPEDTRIVLPMTLRADEAEVLQGAKLTSALMVGLLGVVATLFVAFVVDNVRRQRVLASEVEELVTAGEAGRQDAESSSVHRLPPGERPHTASASAVRGSRTRT